MAKNDQHKPKGQLRTIARFSGIGFQMLAIIALGTWGGSKLDGENPDFPIYTLVLSLLSVLAALYLIIREVISNNE